MFKGLNEMARIVHENARDHGWWEGGGRPFPEVIALIHSEVSEALEAYRDRMELTAIWHRPGKGVNPGKPEGVPVELADVIIRVMDFCAGVGIDLEMAIAEKHAYNITRPYRHGGKRA